MIMVMNMQNCAESLRRLLQLGLKQIVTSYLHWTTTSTDNSTSPTPFEAVQLYVPASPALTLRNDTVSPHKPSLPLDELPSTRSHVTFGSGEPVALQNKMASDVELK